MSDVQQPTTEQIQPEPITVDVDAGTAFTLKLQEFDKAIATAKAQAATLEAQKAAFIYDTNLNQVVEQDKAKKAQPDQTAPQA